MTDESILNPPWMRGQLSKCVAVLWPSSIEVKVRRENRILFNLLEDYAHSHGVPSLASKDHFQIIFNFDFIGFSKVKGNWKIVYEIRSRVDCKLCDGEKKTPLADMSDAFKRDLRYMTDIHSEELVNVAPVKEVITTATVKGKDIEERKWQFVVEPVGCK